MLVLTRKLQEKIHIGDQVTITIVRIQGNTVRVGIEAPKTVRVIRGEIAVAETPDAESVREPGETANDLVLQVSDESWMEEGASETAAPQGVVRHRPPRGLVGRVRSPNGKSKRSQPEAEKGDGGPFWRDESAVALGTPRMVV